MFDMGFLELALIAGIALIVLGPERLPVAARTVGRYIGQARRFVGEFQRQIEQESRLEELNRKIMEDTKGQQFTNNDGSEGAKPEGDETQAEALARAKANRTAEADRQNETPVKADKPVENSIKDNSGESSDSSASEKRPDTP